MKLSRPQYHTRPVCTPSPSPSLSTTPHPPSLSPTSTMSSACATCAAVFGNPSSSISEKQPLPGRYLPCCDRQICIRCLNQNKRYESYCPYCQITTEPSLLPQGLKDPPAYSFLDDRILAPPRLTSRDGEEDELPAYSAHPSVQPPQEKSRREETPDVLHFVAPGDSMHSLALAYGVPINALRKANNIYSDHLIQARRTLLIPGEHYKGGVSLSPRPVEGEEEEARKGKIRRWMMACKVAE
jgi:LysM repeat protein